MNQATPPVPPVCVPEPARGLALWSILARLGSGLAQSHAGQGARAEVVEGIGLRGGNVGSGGWVQGGGASHPAGPTKTQPDLALSRRSLLPPSIPG